MVTAMFVSAKVVIVMHTHNLPYYNDTCIKILMDIDKSEFSQSVWGSLHSSIIIDECHMQNGLEREQRNAILH